ncbi:site-specific integrase [Streptococcus equinus]|uniref:site-specific integrase n=1 Tax=Streptococcus equinus TaxID=1335 RepID=UPI0011450654|nr:site-specific integrase [Streptococcus equinus]GEB11652.1 site-specific integrase [Streptococcus equinus]
MDIIPYKKKDGKTYYKFSFYVGTFAGKKKYIRRFGFKTKGQARAALLQLQDDLDNQDKKSDMTFEELSKQWLKEYEKDVAESTYHKTERNFKNHILPSIGHFKITELTPLIIQQHQNDWSAKLKYGRKLLGLVRNTLNLAVKYGYLENNPAIPVTAPKIKREVSTQKDFYDKEEFKKFMDLVEKTDDIRKLALFRLLGFTGIRKGEMLALDWKDYKDETLSISKAVTRTPAGLEISVTKNKSSERLISLDRITCTILDKLHETYPNSILMFESENGGIMTPSLPRKWLLQIISGSDLQPIKIHGFRHTHASLLFDAGLSLKQVQYRLGHSDLKTTMNVYTHITQKAIDDIGEKFSNYIDF